jgi:hypothetical protein
MTARSDELQLLLKRIVDANPSASGEKLFDLCWDEVRDDSDLRDALTRNDGVDVALVLSREKQGEFTERCYAQTLTRYDQIIDAYDAALGGRDPDKVDIVDLLPAIYKAAPSVTDAEIGAALRWAVGFWEIGFWERMGKEFGFSVKRERGRWKRVSKMLRAFDAKGRH